MSIKSFLPACMLLLVMSCFSFVNALAGGDDITGVWMVPEKDAQVEVFKCGDNYCGKIVWLDVETEADGTPRKDINNKDKALQSREIMGMQMLSGFSYNADSDKYEGGNVYNSRDGKTYSGYIQLLDNGDLYLKGGYKVFGYIIGKENTWTRVK